MLFAYRPLAQTDEQNNFIAKQNDLFDKAPRIYQIYLRVAIVQQIYC